MKYVVVDVESDGPFPPKFSMVCFGAVIVEPGLKKTFYARVKPISQYYLPDALAISGFSRKEHETFSDPRIAMEHFESFLITHFGVNEKPKFLSDNPAYDFAWINHYFHTYVGSNPFGYSARRIGDLYCGLMKDTTMNDDWKKYRKTPADHNPVNDAVGNAEAFMYFAELGLKIDF